MTRRTGTGISPGFRMLLGSGLLVQVFGGPARPRPSPGEDRGPEAEAGRVAHRQQVDYQPFYKEPGNHSIVTCPFPTYQLFFTSVLLCMLVSSLENSFGCGAY